MSAGRARLVTSGLRGAHGSCRWDVRDSYLSGGRGSYLWGGRGSYLWGGRGSSRWHGHASRPWGEHAAPEQ
ncbi:hypothetical protein [Streptomyces sp. NRRL B-1347]|uniref:hypothetical protein n=1 Tax=Streptomyces sp. NRRL B-1347 TaxID=1476877 RepID=UPI00131B9789|nr:hypothetical protein [Streptomyces sp. NRRL B-1347]